MDNDALVTAERIANACERIAAAMETGNALTMIMSGLIDAKSIQGAAMYNRTLQGALDALGKLHKQQAEEREASNQTEPVKCAN